MNKYRLSTDGFPIPVVDLFAGPGGLGEGFSRARRGDTFKVVQSVEMEKDAVATLRLRAFQRMMPPGSPIPHKLIKMIKGEVTSEEFWAEHPEEWQFVKEEIHSCELGPDTTPGVIRRITTVLGSRVENGRWVLIGGPPCQAYSLAGRARTSRARRSGTYLPEEDNRHFLYAEYLRILAELRPAVFVMENVKGMLSARIAGQSMFHQILSDLRDPGRSLGESNGLEYLLYPLSGVDSNGSGVVDPSSFIVECEKHGIPQKRHRVIIVGIRSDYSHCADSIKLAFSEPPNVRQMIGDLPKIRSRRSRGVDGVDDWKEVLQSAEWRILLGAAPVGRFSEKHKRMHDAIQLCVNGLVGHSREVGGYGAPVLTKRSVQKCRALADWISGIYPGFVFNHEARLHMDSDLLRYMYSSVHAKLEANSPKLADLPEALLPAHKNVGESIRSNALFNDRFRVQMADGQASTITSHICKDGHGFIHYDPHQCRTLSVREAARLQTFPDDYIFCGSRTAQYRQVGNAVPPYLAYQIANAIADSMIR